MHIWFDAKVKSEHLAPCLYLFSQNIRRIFFHCHYSSTWKFFLETLGFHPFSHIFKLKKLPFELPKSWPFSITSSHADVSLCFQIPRLFVSFAISELNLVKPSLYTLYLVLFFFMISRKQFFKSNRFIILPPLMAKEVFFVWPNVAPPLPYFFWGGGGFGAQE